MTAELALDQGECLKTAFETLKDFGQESIIYFRPNEVEIVGVDMAKVVDICLLVPADKVVDLGGSYTYTYPEKEVRLGVRNKAVAGALKRFSAGDRLTIGAKIGCDKEFTVSVWNKNKCFTSSIVAPAIDQDNLVPRDIRSRMKYDHSICMNSTYFHSIVGDLTTCDSPVINFEFEGDKSMRVVAEGLFSRGVVELKDANTIDEDATQFVNNSSINVRESFATAHLQKISKAKNLSKRITISVASSRPGLFEYDTPMGKLSYLVCPRISEDIDDPRLKPPAGSEPPLKRRYTVDYSSDGPEDIE